MNIIFPLSVADGIMGALLLSMNSCMYARMYVYLCSSLYMYAGVLAFMCVRLANDFINDKTGKI